MTITISPELEAEQLILGNLRVAPSRAVGEGWVEMEENPLDESDPLFSEIHAAVMEGLEQADRGEGRPARAVFSASIRPRVLALTRL
jgi:hypothetical protein